MISWKAERPALINVAPVLLSVAVVLGVIILMVHGGSGYAIVGVGATIAGFVIALPWLVILVAISMSAIVGWPDEDSDREIEARFQTIRYFSRTSGRAANSAGVPS